MKKILLINKVLSRLLFSFSWIFFYLNLTYKKIYIFIDGMIVENGIDQERPLAFARSWLENDK